MLRYLLEVFLNVIDLKAGARKNETCQNGKGYGYHEVSVLLLPINTLTRSLSCLILLVLPPILTAHANIYHAGNDEGETDKVEESEFLVEDEPVEEDDEEDGGDGEHTENNSNIHRSPIRKYGCKKKCANCGEDEGGFE